MSYRPITKGDFDLIEARLNRAKPAPKPISHAELIPKIAAAVNQVIEAERRAQAARAVLVVTQPVYLVPVQVRLV